MRKQTHVCSYKNNSNLVHECKTILRDKKFDERMKNCDFLRVPDYSIGRVREYPSTNIGTRSHPLYLCIMSVFAK